MSMERPLRDKPRLEPSSQTRWGDDGGSERKGTTSRETYLPHLGRIYKAAGAAAWRRPKRRGPHRALGDSDPEHHARGGFEPAEALSRAPVKALSIAPLLDIRFYLRRIYTKPWTTMFLSSSISDSSHTALLATQQPSHLATSHISTHKLLTQQPNSSRMSTQNSDSPKFKSLLEVIQDCNSVTGPQKEWYRLMLPDKQGELQYFGILLPHVVAKLPWEEHGFDMIRKGNVIQPQAGQSTPEIISKNLRALAVDDTSVLAFRDLGTWRDSKKKEVVGLIGGHPDIKIPDYLVPYLGVIQVGVHLTVYSDGQDGVRVYLQRRSNKTTYPDMLDQFAAGGLQHNETTLNGLCREVGEEAKGVTIDYDRVKYDGDVVFFTWRPESSGKFKGTLEISAKACYSFKVPEGFKMPVGSNINDQAVGGFECMSADEVIKALKDGKFKPNSALVAIKALLAIQAPIDSSESEKAILAALTANLPLPLPCNLNEGICKGNGV